MVDLFFVIIGLCIGLVVVKLISSPPKIIMKYPTLNNIKDTVYVDENGQCYKYYAEQIKC